MSWIRTFLVELYTWARIAVGLVFFLSGRGKLFVLERREQMRQTLVEAHVPFPYLRDLDTLWRVGSEPGEMRTMAGQ